MKKGTRWLLLLALVLVGVAGLSSCADDIANSEHYKTPDWLKGNAYEVMQKEGKYTTFLKGIDLTGNTGIVAGKSILTVAAPDDDAFAAFLQKKGCSSIEQLYERDPQYVSNLIGMHLMYYAFDWQKMVNFRPADGDAATEEQRNVGAGYYYKHRTHSQDPVEKMRVKFTADAVSDTLLSIYHYQRYLPVMSNRLFDTKQIDAKRNYEYFYGEGRWGGNDNGDGCFNIGNAKVSDTNNVITDNGYLYHVDEVIEPVNTIYDELRQSADYSQFLSLYDAYSTYDPVDDDTNNSLGYIAYKHSHGDLLPIAWEWPYDDWRHVVGLEMVGYNLFAPTNKALDEFFRTYWTPEGGYTSLDNLDPLISRYFIMQSFASSKFLAFPEEIESGEVLTLFDTPIDIVPDDVTFRKVCCNGLLYGMDHMKAPAIFSSVVGPAFQDKQFACYLYALDGAGNTILTLSSRNNSFVALMPTNKQFENSVPPMRLNKTTQGTVLEQYNEEAGVYSEMGSGQKQRIVNLNTATGISELPLTGTAVVETNTPFNYWFVNNGKITTNGRFNEQLQPGYDGDPYVAFHPLYNNGQAWANGMAYTYDSEDIFQPSSGNNLAHSLEICQDKNYDYYLFTQLLAKAGLLTGGVLAQELIPADALRFFCFIPTNEAIKANLTKLPGCSTLKIAADGSISGTVSTANKTKLSDYLRSYFVVTQESFTRFTAYPFIGSGCATAAGTVYTTQGSNELTVIDNGTSLSITNGATEGKVGVSDKYSYLPFVFSDGCMQFIDGVLGY